MASDLESPAAGTEEKPKLSLDVKVEKPSACQRHVTVTVTRDDIDRYFKEAFDELAPTAEVPGFRKGKAPRKLVEGRFREQMGNQVKGSLLMDSVAQASEDCDFSAISEPDFDFAAIELPEEGPMTFEFDIEVRPEFDLPDWKGLKLQKATHEYSDDEVDEHLKGLLAKYGNVTEKEGPVEKDDKVELSITFKEGDTVLSETETSMIAIKPKLSFGEGNIEGFDKLVIGSKAGDELEAKIAISEDAENEALRGKEVTATIKVLAVTHHKLPELTPSFLDTIGGFEDESELREAVRGELERQLVYHQQRQIRQQIASELVQTAAWDLPPDLLRRQSQRELERAVLELRSSGFTDDMIRTYQNELRQNSMASTERSLKEHFIFERIAEESDIEADPQDFEHEIRLIASQAMDSPRRVRARLEKRGQMDALRNQIIERKVIDLITSHAEISETEFKPAEDDTVAIDHAIGGQQEDSNIPNAKYGGDAEELREPTDRT